MTVAEQSTLDTGRDAGNFTRAKADWVSDSPMAGRPRPEGKLQMASVEPELAYDEPLNVVSRFSGGGRA